MSNHNLVEEQLLEESKRPVTTNRRNRKQKPPTKRTNTVVEDGKLSPEFFSTYELAPAVKHEEHDDSEDEDIDVVSLDEDTSSPTNFQSDTVQRVPYLVDSDESHSEDDKKSRSRILFTAHQLQSLREVFQTNKYPKIDERLQLADSLGMTHKSVKQWFQNARSKLKKRGTDHVTGFYASKLAARKPKNSDKSSPTTLEYGRFKISTASQASTIEDRVSPVPARQSPTSFGNPSANHQKASSHQHLKKPKAVSSSHYSRSTPVIPTPITDTPVSAKAPSNGGRQQKRARPSSSESAGFQQMMQVSLPANHPFCNLGNPDYVWPEEVQAPADKPETCCKEEHDSTVKCHGKTHDDILASYLSLAASAQPTTVLPMNSPESTDDEERHAQKRRRVDIEPKRRSVDQVAPNLLTPPLSPVPTSSVVHHHPSEVPLDLSMKGRQRDNSPSHGQSKVSPPGSTMPRPVPVFRPVAAVRHNPYQVPHPIFMPFGLPSLYRR